MAVLYGGMLDYYERDLAGGYFLEAHNSPEDMVIARKTGLISKETVVPSPVVAVSESQGYVVAMRGEGEAKDYYILPTGMAEAIGPLSEPDFLAMSRKLGLEKVHLAELGGYKATVPESL